MLSAQDSNQVGWSVLSPHEVVSFLVGGVDAGDIHVGLQTKTGSRCLITGRHHQQQSGIFYNTGNFIKSIAWFL